MRVPCQYACACQTLMAHAIQYVPKTLPCMVRFTPDRLRKTEVKRVLNGPRTDAERTVHGSFRFTYARTKLSFTYVSTTQDYTQRGFQMASHACPCVIEKLSSIQC